MRALILAALLPLVIAYMDQKTLMSHLQQFNQGPQPSGSTSRKTSVKSSVKTGSYIQPPLHALSYGQSGSYGPSGSFGPPSPGTFTKSCGSLPKPPINSKVMCASHSGCRATCFSQHTFPNGADTLYINCVNGRWIVENSEWDRIPDCIPICHPPCENSGVCISPDRCECNEKWTGRRCEVENKPCLNYNFQIMNSRRTCSSTRCTITCLKGHEFPDGSAIVNLQCKEGSWVPARNDWVPTGVPDCRPTCNPKCQNGGVCLSLNVCQCPNQWRGPQCQYRADVCNVKNLRHNGGFNCSGDAESFSCSVSCPAGVSFEYPPSPFYKCFYHTGQFVPQPVPRCLYTSNVQFIPLGGMSGHTFSGSSYSGSSYGSSYGGRTSYQTYTGKDPIEVDDMVKSWQIPDTVYIKGGKNGTKTEDTKVNLPKPAACITWGGVHFKTFDGKVYSFSSGCTFTLVRDRISDSFSVQIRTSCKGGGSCHRVINIYTGDKQYTLDKSEKGDPIFYVDNKKVALPSQLSGIRVELIAHHVMISLDTVGTTLRWDTNQMVEVMVTESLWNRTAGLCGNVNGQIEDDLKGLKNTGKLIDFVGSWQEDDLGERCEDEPDEKHGCEAHPGRASEALKYCQSLLADPRFGDCKNRVDLKALQEACRWDYCACSERDGAKCACQTVDALVRECRRKSGKIPREWRDDKTCPMKCDKGRQYMSCGPSKGRQPSCGATPDEIIFKPNRGDSPDCEEGCYCPSGTVLREGECITIERCPCSLRGKSFSPGETVPKDCNTCTCKDGRWKCSEAACGARCSAIGDPHYQTFDGRRYDFMGQCSYVLMKTSNLTVEAENVACAGSISQAMNFPASISGGMPSCTKSLTIKTPSGDIIKLKQGREVLINGQEVSELPHFMNDAFIRLASSLFAVVEMNDGVEIWWDGMTRAYIDIPAGYRGKTKGLCGTFNSNQLDDFLTSEGDVEKSIIPFGNKWKTDEKCPNLPDIRKTHPCDQHVQKKEAAEKHCGIIKSKLFERCHWMVDPEQAYQDCLYDVCSCELKTGQCLCPLIASYARECAEQGIIIEWRAQVRECGERCPPGQIWQTCGDSCSRSCQDISLRADKCRKTCAEGCNCPPGKAIDENGDCIPVVECPCTREGLKFPPGYVEIRPASIGQLLCKCTNGAWECREAKTTEIMTYPKSSDLKAVCSSVSNQEFTTCEPVDPPTCKNMHSHQPSSPAICRPGCKCKQGYVLDVESNKCVKPTECPCHHGGRSYQDGQVVKSECSECTCSGGQWKCDEKVCWGECTAWGDSHYVTFDGKVFDHQGQCDYILAKGSFGDSTPGVDDSFDVTIQNVLCSTLGATCSKAVTIRVGDEKITLTSGRPVPEHKALKRMAIRSNPQLVVIEASDLGLILRWDRLTRVYIRLDPKWRGRTKGLCGNYNNNQLDDFQTPSGGVSEVSAKIFGDSWRLQEYCPEAEQIELGGACEKRPERKTWASRKCSLLKQPPFSSCHAEVDVGPWLERCIFDTCACDQGGDCECLCTALAAYAHECNTKGVPIKWRSQELCPMQCDEKCARYVPCMSTCPPENCENLFVINKIGVLCEHDSCVEGCLPKECPKDQVRVSSNVSSECVPKAECPKPVCLKTDEVTYYEGDVISEDDCHKCHCSRGNKVCTGEPCPPTTVYTTPKMKDDLVHCVDGWTVWINQEKHRPGAKGRSRGQPSEKEPIPSQLVMNELKGAKCNEHQMLDIQCRTVDTHQEAKSTGLDVECSLERGLICLTTPGKGQRLCPDFEIRILCECQPPTTVSPPPGVCQVGQPNQPHPQNCHAFLQCVPGSDGPEWVEKTCGPNTMYNHHKQVCDWPSSVAIDRPECVKKSKAKTKKLLLMETTTHFEELIKTERPGECPVGYEWSACAIECERMCLYYGYIINKRGKCTRGQVCEEGCVSAERRTSCPIGMLWRDANTCVQTSNCLCFSHEGMPVQPGEIYRESECELCQCIDNHYVCDRSVCERGTTVPEVEVTTQPEWEYFTTEATITPPVECDPNLYIDLIEGDIPLNDEAFSASSSYTPAFAPSAARFNKGVTDKSSGAWTPAEQNKMQYLQVMLPEVEPLYGIIMKGSPLYDQYVTSYHVLYSKDGLQFAYLTKEGEPQLFRGPIEPRTPMKQMFEPPIEAKALRISPQSWHDSIAIQMEIIGCQEPTTTGPSLTLSEPICKDPMKKGMIDKQIKVSSVRGFDSILEKISLDSKSAWQPLTNSPTEWVRFNFMTPRNITGVETKGGPHGWVSAYHVKYSIDKTVWNQIVDDEGNEILFLGNYEHNKPQINYFSRPIRANYVRIEPVKWKDNIQMRIEVLGCYENYDHGDDDGVGRTLFGSLIMQDACNTCPNVPPENNTRALVGLKSVGSKGCTCGKDLYWDGEGCVIQAQCPCVVHQVRYPVGTTFEGDDCSNCLCLLFGKKQCRKKMCDKCPAGLRSELTATCGCVCKPCPEGKFLCPTSDICIDKELWCNGIDDCPDDEKDCPTTTAPTTIEPPVLTTKIPILRGAPPTKAPQCPIAQCQPGYKVVMKEQSRSQRYHQYLSPMFYSYTGRKTASKNGAAKGRIKVALPRKPVEELPDEIIEKKEQKCPEFSCERVWKPPIGRSVVTPPPCPPASCPPNYRIIYESDDLSNCPKYECKPPPPQDSVCNVTGRTFGTFDGTIYQYDVCDHVLARDLSNDDWDIILSKNCETPQKLDLRTPKLGTKSGASEIVNCNKKLAIRHSDEVVTIFQDLSIEYNGFKYNVAQTKKIGAKNKSFVISRMGDTLLFVSNHYGFWVMWDRSGNVKIGVCSKVLGKIDGLCGFYNNLAFDDKRKPDGTQARTTVEFGDSWSASDRQCDKLDKCPEDIRQKAMKMCSVVREHTFGECHGIVDVGSFVSRCMDTACDCLKQTRANSSVTSEEWCRCQILEGFVVQCFMTGMDVRLNDWRVKHECPAICPAPLVHHDCYRRRCEPSCQNLQEVDPCPVVNGVCFPGCYCPPGTVRKNQECVPARQCRDCECNVLPNLKYVQFDGTNVTVKTNCSYVMVQDKVHGKKEHEFMVVVSNSPCKQNPSKNCPEVITLTYGGHVVQVTRSFDGKKLDISLDGAEVVHLPFQSDDWVEFKEKGPKHVNVLIPKIQLELTVYYPSLGASVKLPSHSYGGKLEGLCGNCNKDKTDDMQVSSGRIVNTLEEFIHGWLHGDENACYISDPPCEEIPNDPCLTLLDPEIFGQCHLLLSPSIFLETCHHLTCGQLKDRACIAIETYAVGCSSNGLCVDWHIPLCPAKKCPSPQSYKLCGPSCSPTCDNYKTISKKTCSSNPVEGCFCPEGLVMRNNTCVPPRLCHPCDKSGHFPGDSWKVDACTSCECDLETQQVRCQTQQCPALETVCEQGYSTIKLEAGEDECCPKYLCVPATASPTCETPQKPKCAVDQVMKMITNSDGCQQFICQCKPPEDCPPLEKFSEKLVEPGMKRFVDETGCCKVAKLQCKEEFCPKPPEHCPQFHKLKKEKRIGSCCTTYECERDKDKCIYELSWMAGSNGGERTRTGNEKELVGKKGGERWNDGPCRSCRCEKVGMKLDSVCSKTECTNLSQHPDRQDYELELRPIINQCCPDIARVGCRHNGKVYTVGGSWRPNSKDPCVVAECQKSELGDGVVIRTKVKSCDTRCDPGWKLDKPAQGECCGKCHQWACLVDGKTKAVGEEWSSPDHCTKFKCVSINGAVQVQSNVITCPKISEDLEKEFDYTWEAKPGECCGEWKQVACKVDGRTYKVGETWPSPDGDRCKEVTCIRLGDEITKQKVLKQCNTDCAPGWEYKPASSGNSHCCGECVQVACVVNGTIKDVGSEWSSDDGCTLYSCDRQGASLGVISSKEQCPDVSKCPENALYDDGCCERCNLTISDLRLCTVEEIPLTKTQRLISYQKPPYGLCYNPQPIKGFTECKGGCKSGTVYNPKTGYHDNVCTCCRSTRVKTLTVEMRCESGFTFKKTVNVPSECECLEGCQSPTKSPPTRPGPIKG